MIIEVWADGSAKSVPEDGDPGGWGVVLRTEGGRFYKELSGVIQHAEAAPTHNDMEMHAVMKGLEAVKKPEIAEEVVLYTDSEVTIKRCMARSWREKVILMGALHEQLKRIRRATNLRIQHVPGHAGYKYNERAHELAYAEYQKAKGNAGVTGDSDEDPKAREFRIKMELDRRKKEQLAKEADEILPTLDPNVWGQEAIENVRKLRDPAARFYPFVTYNLNMDEPCRVKVRGKPAWLLQVLGGRCSVSFKHKRKWNSRKRGDDKWEYAEMERFPLEEVVPI